MAGPVTVLPCLRAKMLHHHSHALHHILLEGCLGWGWRWRICHGRQLLANSIAISLALLKRKQDVSLFARELASFLANVGAVGTHCGFRGIRLVHVTERAVAAELSSHRDGALLILFPPRHVNRVAQQMLVVLGLGECARVRVGWHSLVKVVVKSCGTINGAVGGVGLPCQIRRGANPLVLAKNRLGLARDMRVRRVVAVHNNSLQRQCEKCGGEKGDAKRHGHECEL